MANDIKFRVKIKTRRTRIHPPVCVRGRKRNSRRMGDILGGSCSADLKAVTLLGLEDDPLSLFKSSEFIRCSFCDFEQIN
jgi:hypothetical protein